MTVDGLTVHGNAADTLVTRCLAALLFARTVRIEPAIGLNDLLTIAWHRRSRYFRTHARLANRLRLLDHLIDRFDVVIEIVVLFAEIVLVRRVAFVVLVIVVVGLLRRGFVRRRRAYRCRRTDTIIC